MSETLCEKCGRQLGDGHERQPTDCVIDHVDHHEQFVGLTCRRHYHWIDQTLREILALFSLLPSVLVPGPGGNERRSAAVESSAPGRLDVMALTDRRAIHYVGDPDAIPGVPVALDSWVSIVLEDRAITSNGDGSLASSVGLLRRERRWIAAQPWVDEYAADLALFHRAVAYGVGDTMWPKSIGPCPNCKAPLFNTTGIDVVTCRRCKSTWEGVHLVRLRLLLEQESTG